MSFNEMIICVGPTGSGKTCILRKLQEEYCSDGISDTFCTISTVGTNIAHVRISKKRSLSIHECGGVMAPIWKSHFDDCTGVIFVIDANNVQQISCATIQLLELLNHSKLKSSEFLLIFNKIDIKTTVALQEMQFIMRLDDILQHSHQSISIVECSCLTGKGLDGIKLWLQKFI